MSDPLLKDLRSWNPVRSYMAAPFAHNEIVRLRWVLKGKDDLIEAWHAKCRRMDKKIAILRDDNAGLMAENQLLGAENERLQREAAALRKKVAELDADNDVLLGIVSAE